MTDCLFCRIINGEIPCDKIYEDKKTLAFLDIGPSVEGHALVIPKNHSENILEANLKDLNAIFQTIQKIVPAILKATESTGININSNTNPSAGQIIMHTHIHLLPRKEDDGLRLWPKIANYPEEKIPKLADKIKTFLK